MSLSKIKSKTPVAIDLTDKSLVYYHEAHAAATTKMTSEKGFVPYHYDDTVGYITGRRKAGKSTFCSLYAKSYVKATKGKVFLISRLEDDPSMKLPKRSMQIPLDQIDMIEMEDLSNSLVIVDDIASNQLNKDQRELLFNLVTDLIENSRHYNISVLVTSHLATNYSKTRSILNEASFITVFPHYSNAYQTNRVLHTYFGLSNSQINEIYNKDTRWVMVTSIEPKMIITQHEIYLY